MKTTLFKQILFIFSVVLLISNALPLSSSSSNFIQDKKDDKRDLANYNNFKNI
eukprot:jgi/Orpsp1_1/1181266/evm.model.c7180000076520.1